jgi:hypothetical protein
MFDPATMFDMKGMPTYGGVSVAIYGLSGITLVLLTMLTFQSNLIMPDKDNTEEASPVETPQEEISASVTPPMAEAVEAPELPVAEAVPEKQSDTTLGGKRKKTRSKKNKGSKKRKNSGTKRSKK